MRFVRIKQSAELSRCQIKRSPLYTLGEGGGTKISEQPETWSTATLENRKDILVITELRHVFIIQRVYTIVFSNCSF